MAEDHGLSNGDGPIEVTQGLELLVSAAAQDIVLFDGVQGLFLTLQFDNVWVWDHFLGKLPHRVFKGGGEKQHLAHPARECPGISLPLDADALILVALSGYHDISLIQNKHLDFLGINELELGAPVQHGPRGANDNLLTDLLASFHCGNPGKLQLWVKFAHLLNHVSCLKRQLVCWGEAQTLMEKSSRMSLGEPFGNRPESTQPADVIST
uniref:Uncharacterized protein n=1 Tax=Saimiri boliviensis boliviensis TaxID=39432 RepID=A0A2K6U3T4_SAIBB